MCGPTVAWDWLVMDVSYVLALVGGGLVLRARGSTLTAWLLFGMMSVAVGALVFSISYLMVQGQPALAGTTETAAMLGSC